MTDHEALKLLCKLHQPDLAMTVEELDAIRDRAFAEAPAEQKPCSHLKTEVVSFRDGVEIERCQQCGATVDQKPKACQHDWGYDHGNSCALCGQSPGNPKPATVEEIRDRLCAAMPRSCRLQCTGEEVARRLARVVLKMREDGRL